MTKQQRITQDARTLDQFGSLERGGYLFGVDRDAYVVRVYNVKTRQLVAFSSTKADYQQSVEEFLADYGG